MARDFLAELAYYETSEFDEEQDGYEIPASFREPCAHDNNCDCAELERIRQSWYAHRSRWQNIKKKLGF